MSKWPHTKTAEPPPPLPLAVGPSEAAKMMSFTTQYVRFLCIDGKLGARKIGKYWRIPTEEIKKFLDGKDGS